MLTASSSNFTYARLPYEKCLLMVLPFLEWRLFSIIGKLQTLDLNAIGASMPLNITPVILSGGSGTRLWPLSVPSRPKQFIPLVDDVTMFAKTLGRVSDQERFSTPLIIGATRHAALIANENYPGKIILEPCPRGTAPAIALAALEAGSDDTLLLVLSSDHAITKPLIFLEGVEAATKAAKMGWLVCLGIQPTYPETGYGYIELETDEVSPKVNKVSRFVEKPALETAQGYIDSGNHVWNAGIFLFRADRLLEALSMFAPFLMQSTVKAWKNAKREENIIAPEATAFEAIQSGSIDKIVMEHADNVACVTVDMGWSDIGSWDAIYELASKTKEGNVISGNVTSIECQNTLIRGEGIPVAAYGVNDMIIVATETGVLVLPRAKSQQVKNLLAILDKDTSI